MHCVFVYFLAFVYLSVPLRLSLTSHLRRVNDWPILVQSLPFVGVVLSHNTHSPFYTAPCPTHSYQLSWGDASVDQTGEGIICEDAHLASYQHLYLGVPAIIERVEGKIQEQETKKRKEYEAATLCGTASSKRLLACCEFSRQLATLFSTCLH